MKPIYDGEDVLGAKRMRGILVFACVCVSSVVSRTADTELDDLLLVFTGNRTLSDQDVNRTSALVMKIILQHTMCVQQGFADQQCSQCFNSNQFVSGLSANSSTSTIEQLSVMVLNRLLKFRSLCATTPPSGCIYYEECRNELQNGLLRDGDKEHIVEDILRSVKAVYQPSDRNQCFSAQSVLQEIASEEESFTEKIAHIVVRNLLAGRCIDVGEAVTDFLNDLFHRYGDKNTQTITSNGLSKLLLDLKIGGLHDHDHHDHKDHDHHEDSKDHDHHNHHEDSKDHDHHNHHEDSKDHDNHEHNHDDHDHHNHNHNGTDDHDHHNHGHNDTEDHDHQGHDHVHDHNHNKITTAIYTDDNVTDSGVSHRQKRHKEHDHDNLASQCLSPDLLFQKFSHSTEGLLTQSEFMQLCPALVQQHVSRVCAQQPKISASKQPPSSWELYVYGSISVLIISLCSCFVVVILPVMHKSIYPYLLTGLLGLAYGTMSGDAMLHLIPQVLELHSHGPEGGHEGHHHHEDDHHKHGEPEYFWKQMGILITIYAIFLFETILGMMSKNATHSHSYSPCKETLPADVRQEDGLKNKTESNIELTMNTNSSLTLNDDDLEKKSTNATTHFDSPNVCFGMKSLALVVTIGDTIHNFGDGLAIGAAFAGGIQGGISTSLAVFCHELPHEFGDFVILLSTGLSFKRALLINFLSALSCFVGLYIGIPLGEDKEARLWVLTITAGIFLYVALVEMLPELKSNQGASKIKMFLTKNIGVIAGTASMVCMGLFEDRIHI